MRYGETVTKEQLKKYIDDLGHIFDMVRIVDPYGFHVLDDDFKVSNPDHVCYKIWNKNFRCRNCISLKAYTDFERKVKYEFQGEDAYFVIAMPYRLSDEDNRVVVVEMMNEVSEEMQVRTVGKEIVAKTINDFDHKLYTDSLTGVYNRRYFDDKMFLYQTKDALSKKMGFILWDVMKFKNVNDTYGHAGGDKVLKAIAQVMQKNTREEEAVMRIGGDEFLIVVQDCEKNVLQSVASRIQRKVEEIRIPDMPSYRPAINVGYSYTDEFDASGERIHVMLDEADREMYMDKEQSYQRLDEKRNPDGSQPHELFR